MSQLVTTMSLRSSRRMMHHPRVPDVPCLTLGELNDLRVIGLALQVQPLGARRTAMNAGYTLRVDLLLLEAAQIGSIHNA